MISTLSMKRSIFAHLGFDRLAERIYRATLKHGPCSIADLTRLTGKYRPAIYAALPGLLESNLLSKEKRGKRILFRAESPAILSALVKKQNETLESLIPSLMEDYQRQTDAFAYSIFEGKEGIETAYEQFISRVEKDGSIYRYESPKDYSQNKKFYPSLYWKRAGSQGDINKFVITNQTTNRARHKSINRFSKEVAFPLDQDMTQLINSTQVMFIDYASKKAILIDHERFADFQLKLFKMVFDTL